MRKRKEHDYRIPEPDLTPMIDMTFQLIAFFMVLMNFSQSEQNDRVTLPESELARPADAPVDFPITLHVPADGTVVIGGITSTLEGVRPLLNNEISLLQAKNKGASDANIIIRAHRDVPGGVVQDFIRKCQDLGFEKFTLRVKEDQRY
ncbi:MAG: ExbD/TolR family protein [Pirellulaceae bacterium]|jgi:biopolymer transport protein ExbD